MSTSPTRRIGAALLTAGLLVAACGDDDTTAEPTTSTMVDDMADGHGHSHGEPVEVAAEGAPTLDIEITEDPKSGLNVQLVTTNFAFAPEAASTDHVDGEGHAHVYVDGEKLGRVYTDWIHLDLKPGDHEIRVELNSNDHRPFSVDGEPVEVTETVTVASSDDDGHGHGGHGEPFAVDADDAPTITLEVTEDPKSGYNVEIVTENFTFAPERASTEAIEGEGHAHLYVDGRKMGRLYGNWFHLPTPQGEGDVEVRVELSANDHRAYAVDGEIIEGVVSVAGDGTPVEDDASTPEEAADEMAMADVAIEITVTGGESDGDARYEANLGELVTISITSDTADELHVHGYDLYADLVPGEAVTLSFVADIPGVFEVELESNHVLLFDLAVS